MEQLTPENTADIYAVNATILTSLLMGPRVDLELEAAWSDVAHAVPELAALDMDQGGARLHKDNVAHTIAVTAKTPPRLRVRLLALFHDVGKPATRCIEGGLVTFYGHEAAGEALTVTALTRLGYDDTLVYDVATLVKMSGDTKGSSKWTDSAVRRFIATAGDLLDDLLDFAKVDVTSKHRYKHDEVEREVAQLRTRIDEVRARDLAAAWRPVVSGDAIMARFALTPSRHVGDLLRLVVDAQRAVEATGQEYSVEQALALLDREVAAGR